MISDLLASAWTAPSFSWDFRTASHLLNRAGFGGTPDEISALAAQDPQEAVRSIVYYSAVPDHLPKLDFGLLTDPKFRSFRQARRFLLTLPKAQRREFLQLHFAASREKIQEMRCWWIDRMVRTRRPLEEKMTLLWHGLFVSAYPSVNNAYHLYIQNQLFRRLAVGNVKTLTLGISQDPAMLRYLNNNQNRKGHPNENFARELMELFTLGIGNYTEEDVRQSARAWTGWSFQGDHFVLNRRQHDEGIKTFLGRTGNFNGQNIINIIFDQPAASRHLATRLLSFFGTQEPPAELIDSLARVLKFNDWEIAPTLTRLFSSRWFYSEDVMRAKIKNPAELIAGSMRRMGVVPENPLAILESMRQMGQELFGAPNVGGWPGGLSWINTSTLFVRYNLPAFLVTGHHPTQQQGNFPGTQTLAFPEFQTGWAPEIQLAQAGVCTTDGAVDFYLRLLVQDGVAPAKRNALIRYLNNTDDFKSRPFNPAAQKWRTIGLVELIMSMPEYQLC